MVSSRVKQRLVGSLVLLALVAVVVPLIFDLEPSTPVDQTTEIPPAPSIEPVIIPQPIEPELDSEVVPLDQVFDLAPPVDDPASNGVVEQSPNQSLIEPTAAQSEKVSDIATDAGEADEIDVQASSKAFSKEASNEPSKELSIALPKALPKVEPKLSASGLPEAWVIQVVSYQEKPKAQALNEKLQSAGFKSFVRTAKVSGRYVHRVFVGPQVLRQHAEDEKARIDRSLGVNSMVIPFEP